MVQSLLQHSASLFQGNNVPIVWRKVIVGLLEIYGWCIMSNHMHLIISAKENNVSDVLGNFKKFPAKNWLLLFKIMQVRAGKNG